MISNSNFNFQEVLRSVNILELIIGTFLGLVFGILGNYLWSKIELNSERNKEKREQLEEELINRAAFYTNNSLEYIVTIYSWAILFVLSVITLILITIYTFQNITHLYMRHISDINIFKEGFLNASSYLSIINKISLGIDVILMVLAAKFIIMVQKKFSYYIIIGNYINKDEEKTKKNH